MKKIVGIIMLILVFASSARGAESLWCRGPLKFEIRNHQTIEVYFTKQPGPAGHNGGKLKPGNCGYEKTPGIGGSHIQMIYPMSDLKKNPAGIAMIQSSYIYFLSSSDYVVRMGLKGANQADYRSVTAIPFKKDRSQRIKKKMGAAPK